MKNKKVKFQGKRSKRKVAKGYLLSIYLILPVIILVVLVIFLGKNVNALGLHNFFSEDKPLETKGTQMLTNKLSEASRITNSEVNNWYLILVNPWNDLPDNFEVSLIRLLNGQSVDERCYPDLQKMMDDCRAEGLDPLICSSYRSLKKQEQLFINKVNALISEGYTDVLAREEAATQVALPGTSEHQTGLALDIVDENNQSLDFSQEDTAVQQWLIQNSWKYGFILRYPEDKTDITGIQYEPWHYRYVGKDAAKQIYEQGICLEEYLKQKVN